MRTFSRPACCRGTRSLACRDLLPRERRAVASPPKRPSTRRAVSSHRGAKAGANLSRGSLLTPPSSFLWANSGPRLKPGATRQDEQSCSLRGDDFDLAPRHPRWAERRLDAEETYPSNRLERGEDEHVGVGGRAAESVQPDALAGDREPGLVTGVLEVAGVDDAHRDAEAASEVFDRLDL